MRAVIVAASVAFFCPCSHAVGHPGLHPAQGRPADPRRGPQDAPDQEGHAHHGRGRLHPGHRGRLRGRALRAGHPAGGAARHADRPHHDRRWCCSGLFVGLRRWSASSTTSSRCASATARGLSKRGKLLGQTVVGAVFGVRRAVASRAPSPSARPWPTDTISFVKDIQLAGHQQGRRAGAVRLRGARDVQRGEPHRRPGRPGHRRLGDGHRRRTRFIAFWQYRHWDADPSYTAATYCYEVRDPLEIAIIAGGRRRGLLRLPVVEHVAGPDLHGRHRVAGAWAAWSPAWRSPPAPCCCCRSSACCSRSSR